MALRTSTADGAARSLQPGTGPGGLGSKWGRVSPENGSLLLEEHRTPQRGSGGTLSIHGGCSWGGSSWAQMEGTGHGGLQAEPGSQPYMQTCLPSALHPILLGAMQGGSTHSGRGSLTTGRATQEQRPEPTALPHTATRRPRSRANTDPEVGRQGDPAWRRDTALQRPRRTCDQTSPSSARDLLVTMCSSSSAGRVSHNHRLYHSTDLDTTLNHELHPNVHTETLKPGQPTAHGADTGAQEGAAGPCDQPGDLCRQVAPQGGPRWAALGLSWLGFPFMKPHRHQFGSGVPCVEE